MLRMKNLSKVYRTHMIETHALRGFDIHVRQGEFVAVTGPSGSGKTTFLNIAGLLETFSGGEYVLDGVNVKGMDDNARSRLRNEKLGFIFQGFNLIPDLNLSTTSTCRCANRGFDAASASAASRAPAARPFLPPATSGRVSGGQQRACDRACPCRRAQLLLADEPTGNLDSQMARGVMELLEEINEQGTTILMVTHDPELAARAQRNVHIIDGQVSDLLRETSATLAAVAATPAANINA